MSRLLILALLVAGAPPQDGATKREAIADELQAKFAALGPVHARAIVQALDLDGSRSVRYEIELHFRPAEFWMHAILRDVHSGSTETHRLYEKEETYLHWEPGKDADKVDNGPYYKWYWKTQFELDAELAKIMGIPADAKSLGEFKTGVRPELVLDLRSDSLEKARSLPRMSMDRSRDGAPSWIQNLRWAAREDIRVSGDEVFVCFPAAGYDTVIDRKTGFLKSIGNNFITGDRRVLVVKEVTTGVKKPEVKKPSRTRTRKPGGDDLAGAFGQFLYGYFHECLDTILANWAKAGAPEKAETLRSFFTMIVARRETLVEDAWHRSWSEAWLRSQRQGGRSLEDIIKKFEDCAMELKEYIQGGDNHYFDMFRGQTEEFKKGLVRRVLDAEAVEEAKSRLARRVEESFERDRIDKARSKLPPPDYRDMLRDAIEEARTAKK